MNLTGNTILITGGGSGIGLALAKEFHQRGNKVIIAGRRQDVLDRVAAANPGIEAIVLDVADPASIAAAVPQLTRDYPTLDTLLNNAGIMRPEDLQMGKVADAEAIVATNLLGPIRLTAALLPNLIERPSATILNVSSGLAFIPLAMTPTYCATKAAIHSWTQSLRYQLRNTSVQVMELAPPYVQTELMGLHQTHDPRAMPLADFIAEVMEILRTQPDAKEILVQRVLPLRYAAEQGHEKYDQFVQTFNDTMHTETSSH
jgi:uncharacterized oxidoreductase